MSIPSAQVGLAYLCDPTEEMLRGDELRDGMVVLIADSIMREDPDRADSKFFNAGRCLETSRWCEVTKLVRERDLVTFVGVYADGSKFGRSYNVSWFWYVKPVTA